MARAFSTAGDRIDVGDPVNPAGDMTVGCWIIMDGKSDFARILSNLSGTTGYTLDTGGSPDDNNIRFVVVTGGAFRVAGPGSVAVDDGSWHFLCGVHDEAGNTVTLYVDDMASADATVAATGGYTTSSANLHIGSNPDGANTYNGKIAHVSVVFAVLDAAQREHLKWLSGAGFDSELNMPILGRASPEPDFSKNLRTGTVTGTAFSDVVMPPVGEWFPAQTEILSGGATSATVVPQIMNHYRRRRA